MLAVGRTDRSDSGNRHRSTVVREFTLMYGTEQYGTENMAQEPTPHLT